MKAETRGLLHQSTPSVFKFMSMSASAVSKRKTDPRWRPPTGQGVTQHADRLQEEARRPRAREEGPKRKQPESGLRDLRSRALSRLRSVALQAFEWPPPKKA